MNMTVDIEPRHEYLYVSWGGPCVLREVKGLSAQVLRASVEHRLSKVLMDVRSVEGSLSTADRYYYATFMAEQSLRKPLTEGLRRMRLAYLGSEPVIDHRRFGELVARNRGMCVKATESMDEALEWLQAEADKGNADGASL